MISGGITKFFKAHQDKGFRLIAAPKIGQS
jgi:hypothetical protein